MLKKVSLFSLFLIIGCNYQMNPNTANEISKEITYFKDQRTNLCFAGITSTTKDGYSVYSITNVPCINVESLLVK